MLDLSFADTVAGAFKTAARKLYVNINFENTRGNGMNYLKESLSILFCVLFLLGCDKKKVIHFYSLDRSHCITVINEGSYRYIINGEHNSLPKFGFVQLYVQGIDPLGDGLHVCWGTKSYDWEVVVHRSKIVESKIDTSKYKFSTSLPVDEHGIPTEIKFRQDGCAVFSFSLMRLSPNKGAIVEY